MSAPLVGRDGNAIGGRGPPGTSAPTMPRVLSAPMVGRDVPGAACARGHLRERHRGHGPPGTSAPTMPRVLPAPLVGRDVPGAPRTRERPRGHRPRPPKADGSAEEEVRAAPLNAFVPIDVTTVFEPSPTASRRAKDPRRPRRVASNKSFTPNGKSEHGRGRAPGYLGPIKKSIFILKIAVE